MTILDVKPLLQKIGDKANYRSPIQFGKYNGFCMVILQQILSDKYPMSDAQLYLDPATSLPFMHITIRENHYHISENGIFMLNERFSTGHKEDDATEFLELFINRYVLNVLGKKKYEQYRREARKGHDIGKGINLLMKWMNSLKVNEEAILC